MVISGTKRLEQFVKILDKYYSDGSNCYLQKKKITDLSNLERWLIFELIKLKQNNDRKT